MNIFLAIIVLKTVTNLYTKTSSAWMCICKRNYLFNRFFLVNENVNLIRLMASYNSNTLRQLTWFLCKKIWKKSVTSKSTVFW